MHVYGEAKGRTKKTGEWKGPLNVVKVNEKQIAVDWDGQPKHFNISQVLPDPTSIGERELERLTKAFDQFRSPPPAMVLITEILAHNNPRSRTPEMEDAKRKELAGLEKRGTFEVVYRKDIRKNEVNPNIMGGRFVLAIKNVRD